MFGSFSILIMGTVKNPDAIGPLAPFAIESTAINRSDFLDLHSVPDKSDPAERRILKRTGHLVRSGSNLMHLCDGSLPKN